MIAIGDFVDEARIYPEKIEQIKTRLEYLSSTDEYPITYAAQKALAEIEKLELEIDQ